MNAALKLGAKSWKTTTVGVLTAVIAIGSQLILALDGKVDTQPDLAIVWLALGALSGLFLARDGDKTSAQVGAE